MRKKVFIATDLPNMQNGVNPNQRPDTEDERQILPRVTLVKYGGPVRVRRAEFARWYGCGIDEITRACQQQIERFVAKQDLELEPMTIGTYFERLKTFLDYCVLLASAMKMELTPADINRTLLDGYIVSLNDGRTSALTQRGKYVGVKVVLKALCARGLVHEVLAGDDATFPANPFPGAHKHAKGEKPLSKKEREAFARAVKAEVMPLFAPDAQPSSNLLSYALLIIALHTGRNTWPLMEMSRDCLRPHPKENTLFLVLYKRRGHSTGKVAVRADPVHDKVIESLPTIRPAVARLIHRAIELSEPLLQEAPPHLRNRVWLQRSGSYARGVKPGQVIEMTEDKLALAIKQLVVKHALTDADGKPLRINVQRLRKTFVNRIFEILDGDIVATAAAAGNTVTVTDVNYLRPGEDAQRNWRFMGVAMVQELLTGTVGATERTPVGRCTDPKEGDYAPKRGGGSCMSFLNCFRCRNYVVTADDLYRLYSFYWRILKERGAMEPQRWQRQLAHIVRLIDRDVIEHGVANGTFKREFVEKEKARARDDPHPFWRADAILTDLASLSR